MKKHIGKIIGIAGVLLMFPGSKFIGPWITHTFFTHRMPDGERVILSVGDAITGYAICGFAGFLVLVIGTTIEVVQAFKMRKPTEQSAGVSPKAAPQD
jgi:hypothetical protein